LQRYRPFAVAVTEKRPGQLLPVVARDNALLRSLIHDLGSACLGVKIESCFKCLPVGERVNASYGTMHRISVALLLAPAVGHKQHPRFRRHIEKGRAVHHVTMSAACVS
jgi:hypothetical protein